MKYIKVDKRVEMTLRTYESVLSQLYKEFKVAEESLDTEELIRIAYHINTITEAYETLRADSDSHYRKGLMFREELRDAVANDDMKSVINIAKKLGVRQNKIAREVAINEGNLSACKNGSINRLSKFNREQVYSYVWNLIN